MNRLPVDNTIRRCTLVLAAVVALCLAGPAGGVEVSYLGTINEGLSAPTSLEASADQIAALQPYNRQILVFTPGGTVTRRIDITGDTRGLARLSQSVYLYCDRDRGVVMALDLIDGRQWEFMTSLGEPADIVVANGECHVLDAAARQVVTADSQGRVTARLDLVPPGQPALGAPSSLAYDGVHDAFHVFEQLESRAHVFGRSTGYLGGYCSFGGDGGTVTRGGGLVCDADGYVYVVDRYQGRVSVFDTEWRFVMDIETGALVGRPLVVPTGIAVDANGTIYVSSTEDDCIHLFYLDKFADPQGELAAAPLYPAPSGSVDANDLKLVARVAAAATAGNELAADFRILADDGSNAVVAEVAGIPVDEVGRDDLDRLVGTVTWRPSESLVSGNTYRWQVRARTESRVGDWSAEAGFSTHPASVPFQLEANYPNPFNPATTIPFTAPAGGDASIEIYDLKGNRVWSETLHDLSAGRHEVTWDGRDSAGTPVASGVYFYRLRSGSFVQTRKMVLVK